MICRQKSQIQTNAKLIAAQIMEKISAGTIIIRQCAMVLITGEATLQVNNDRVQQNLGSNANFGLQT